MSNLNSKWDVVIVGGGPSGMIAAVEAARRGLSVVLLERNEKLGKKLYITGKGRCNLTNAGNREHLIANTVRNGKFLYSAFTSLGSKELMDYVEELGVTLVTERGNRVFPASGKSSDIIRAFHKELTRLGVAIELGQRVVELVCENGAVVAVKTTSGKTYACNAIILATGGVSYSATGSTGDGYKLASALGHSVLSPQASLIPIETAEGWILQLQGLSLKNVRLTALQKGKKLYSEVGEMLFTHFGISGPMALTCSALLDEASLDNAKLILDMKPGLDAEQLDARILRDFQSNPNRALKNSLFELLPTRLCPIVIELAGLNPEAAVNQITKPQREKLCAVMKGIEITPKAYRSIDEAVITHGGISCQEVNPKTMESKIVKGLFICGETLDVDALTGGFNLQIAFSTGCSAGRNC